MDRFSRRIVGWNRADFMTEDLVIPVLCAAIRERQPTGKVIHHTDRGGQYASTSYRAILRRADIRQSMSRTGNCYDNAFMESGFGTFKTELEMTEYDHQRATRDRRVHRLRQPRTKTLRPRLSLPAPVRTPPGHKTKELNCP